MSLKSQLDSTAVSTTDHHSEESEPTSPISSHNAGAPSSDVAPSAHSGEEVDSPEGESDQDESWSDDSGSEDPDGDEDDDEEEPEPSLKYERFAGNTPQLLEKDSACALVISSTSVASNLYVFSTSTTQICALSCSAHTMGLCMFSTLEASSRNRIDHTLQQSPT